MRVKFRTSPAADATMAWGYPIESDRSNGVFGDVPEHMLELEIKYGRVELIQVKPVQDQIKEISEASAPKKPAAKKAEEIDPKLSAAEKTTKGKPGRKSKAEKAAEEVLTLLGDDGIVKTEVPEPTQETDDLTELLNSFGDAGDANEGMMTAEEALALLGDDEDQ